MSRVDQACAGLIGAMVIAQGCAASRALLSQGRPGVEAAAAIQAIAASRDVPRSCERLFGLIEAGSEDPFAYGGAVYCATRDSAASARLDAVLASTSSGTSALFELARGLRAQVREEGDQAEAALRRAVELAPELALGWSALSVVVARRGDEAEAIRLARKALAIAPGLEEAVRTLGELTLRSEAIERLMVRLEALPDRLGELGAPRVPSSGRAPEQVLRAATKEEHARAVERVSGLAKMPIGERAGSVLLFGPLTELELWMPLAIADGMQNDSVGRARIVEAALQLGERAGRRDVLVWMAGSAFDALSQMISPARLARAHARWSAAIGAAPPSRGMALLVRNGGAIALAAGSPHDAVLRYDDAARLYRRMGDKQGEANALVGAAQVQFYLGNNAGALESYAGARVLYESAGDKLGEANVLVGTAEVQFHLGDTAGALEGYAGARVLYESAGDKLGEAHALAGVAKVQFRLGNIAGALEGYAGARALYQGVGNKQGEAHALVGVAQVQFHLRNNADALEAYAGARALYQGVGDKQGEAHVLIGAAQDQFRLGNNADALEAYAGARALYQGVGDKQGEANALVGAAQVQFFLGNNAGALDAYAGARALYQGMGGKWGEANALRGAAEVQFRLGNNTGALEGYAGARALYQSVSDKQGEANTLVGAAQVQFALGNSTGALAGYADARALYQGVGDKGGEAHALVGAAEVQFHLGNNTDALKGYAGARVLYQSGGEKHGEANALVGAAQVQFRLGNNAGALDGYAGARALYQGVGDQRGEAGALFGAAQVQFHLGNNAGALEGYVGAGALYQGVGDQRGEAGALDGAAQVEFHLGNTSGALEGYAGARALYRVVGDKQGEANALVGAAQVQFRLGNDAAALEGYACARVLCQGVGDKHGEANALVGAAQVQLRLGNNAAALEAYAAARALYQGGGDKHGEANALVGAGNVHLASGDRARFRDALRDALQLYQATEAHVGAASAAVRLARVEAVAGHRGDAERLAQSALEHARKLREHAASAEERTSIAETVAGAYDVLVPLAATRSPARTDEAMLLAEEAHAPALLDLLVLFREQTLQLPDQQRRELIQRDLAQPGLTAEARPALELQLRWNETLGALRAELRPGARPKLEPQAITALARDVGPLLLYFAAADALYAFLLRRGQPARLHVAPIARDELGREVRALAKDLANPHREARAAARRRSLWQHLVEPFSGLLPETGPLVIVPHGPLHELPFEALLGPNGEPAFERWDLSVAPSLSVLAELRKRPLTARPAFVGLASGTDLPFTDQDLERISRLFGPTQAPWHTELADVALFEKFAPQGTHLLLSTHAAVVDGEPFASYLELKPTDTHDGRLRQGMVAQTKLPHAPLVVLAACDTTSGRASLADERIDFARAFLMAGASAVLAARWKIPDGRSTTQFVEDFFRALLREPNRAKQRPDVALSEARRLSIVRGDPAQLWAAWALIGGAR